MATKDKQDDVEVPEATDERETQGEEAVKPAATHDDILAAVEEEKRTHDVEHLVQTRAADRPIAAGQPLPQTGVYMVVPEQCWPEHYNFEDHRGHAQQIVQVRTPADQTAGLSTVTFRCDCAAEGTFPWSQDAANLVLFPDEEALDDLRTVPAGFEAPASRTDLDRTQSF